MSDLLIASSGASVLAVVAPIKSGITSLPSLSWTLPDFDYDSVALGATTSKRTNDGTNAEGKECSDEKWLEVKIPGGEWTAVGGGLIGTTVDAAGVETADVRLNIPEGTQTTGDFVANIEIYFF